ncbi:hypothetical protein AVEN_38908-1 [Araneus ventricosus]|uniref:Uncharacterized protein n=1 Tax=Araneus ventricosus TaxID=182803 RepID=A0A4Y2VEG5_ARAVE|nr:hypothetical protein AVEN_38908-1 [Araneus ventricosus]
MYGESSPTRRILKNNALFANIPEKLEAKAPNPADLQWNWVSNMEPSCPAVETLPPIYRGTQKMVGRKYDSTGHAKVKALIKGHGGNESWKTLR